MDRFIPATAHTYADLRRVHEDRLQAAHKSKSEISNQLSALNLFANAAGKSDSSTCDTDLTDDFEVCIATFADLLSSRGVAPPSIANRLSYVRSIRESYKVMLQETNLSGGFRSSLLALMNDRGIATAELAKSIGVLSQIIQPWITRGFLPSPSSKGIVNKIEAFFGLPEGTLMNKIGPRRSLYFPQEADSPLLESRKKRYALTRDKYAYKNPNEEIKAEWKKLLHFYTAPYLLNGEKRATTWRVKDADRVTMVHGEAAITPTGVCATAQIRWNMVAQFLGFLLRATKLGGKGLRETQMSLALLSDPKLTADFIEFKRQRSGKYTREIENRLVFALSLIHKETGFLRQHPEFSGRLLNPVPPEKWGQWCDDCHNELTAILRGLKRGGHIQKGREPQEPIAAILAEQHPIRVLVKMTDRMSQQFTLESCPMLMAGRKRNLLLVKMMITNPLRAHHYSIMSYREDNQGNLYQDASGNWRLRFKAEDFKNQRGAAADDYDVVLSSWLYSDINEYLAKHRPVLMRKYTSDRVFLPTRVSNPQKPGTIRPDTLSMKIRVITSIFIPGCPGFGAHAFRHIVATDYIRNNPQGFQVAANILHDKLGTVMREYAHLKVADGFSHWSNYLETQISAVREVDNE